MAASVRRKTAAAAGSALVLLGAFGEVAAVPCPKGEAVTAYFASGKVGESSYYGSYEADYDYYSGKKKKKDDYGSDEYGSDEYGGGDEYGAKDEYGGSDEYGAEKEGEACSPDKDECYRSASVSSGPDSKGMYTVDWEDGAKSDRKVPAAQVKRASDDFACDKTEAKKPPSKDSSSKDKKPPAKAKEPPVPSFDEDEEWTPPEIPCTIMPRLHWEGSDPSWNKEAVESLRKKYKPDELIDGFDWHVILRFNSADTCEKTYKSLEAVLNKCKEPDPENCRTHKYVKAIEYVGDDPDTRRQTGRAVHKDTKKKGKDEL